MVAGHLREKKGYFYAVLNYKTTQTHTETAKQSGSQQGLRSKATRNAPRRSYRSSGAVSRKMCRLQETFFLQTSWNNGLR